MQKNNIKYIIAGNVFEADNWVKSKQIMFDDWRYVFSSTTLRGIRNPHGVFVGTWMQRKDIREIVELLVYSTDAEELNINLAEIFSKVTRTK